MESLSILAGGWVTLISSTAPEEAPAGGWLQQNAIWVISLLGVAATIIGAYWGRRTGKENVNVSEKDANTRAVANVVETLTEGFAELRQELKEEKERREEDKAESDERIQCLEDEVKILRKSRDVILARYGEVVAHLAAVEALVPTPPGIPPRPAWPEITESPWDDDAT